MNITTIGRHSMMEAGEEFSSRSIHLCCFDVAHAAPSPVLWSMIRYVAVFYLQKSDEGPAAPEA